MVFTRIDLDQTRYIGGSGTLVSDEELVAASGVLRSSLTPMVADVYVTSPQNLTNSWNNVIFGVARIFDSGYIAMPPTGIQISAGGTYEILAGVTTNKIAGNQRTTSGMRLALNNVGVPGTNRAMYNRDSSQGFSSATSHCIINLNQGNIITLQVILVSGQNTVQTVADACSLSIKKLR